MHWINTVNGSCSGKENLCQEIRQFVKKNVDWTRRGVKKHRAKKAYWHHVSALFSKEKCPFDFE